MFRSLILALASSSLLALAPGCKDGGATAAANDPATEQPPPPPPPPVAATGTIAYARGSEIRLVEPDGTGDRALWAVPQPQPSYSVRGLVWRPDGGELAFSSDHEMASSYYERDIYAVSGDGARLRKITNGPSRAELATLPKGTVTVRVQNNSADAGPYFIYVTGAPEPQSVLIPPASARTLTFTNVADFGDEMQLAVAIYGAFRWAGAAAADVKPGSTVSAGQLIITSFGFEHFGADGPAWRADGSKVAFIAGAGTCSLSQVPANPPPGFSHKPLLDPEFKGIVCAYDWSPVASKADQLLLAETDFGKGEGWVYQVTEGAKTRGQPLVTYNSYTRILDLRWLPDGSGFLFAAQRLGSALNENANLYEYTFATKAVRQITKLENEYVRGFSIAPDGRRIAIERASAVDAPASDVWVVGRDGTGLTLVVKNARAPAWNPKRP